MKSQIYPVSIKHQIVTQSVENETLIYEIKTNRVWCLNPTSSFVWKMCDGTKTVRDIAESFSKEFKIKSDESLIWLALDGLRKHGMLVNGEEVIKSAGNTFSRREAIRKAGLTTLAVLPIISTVIAPTALQAQSGCVGLGQTCIFDDQKQSNCCNTDQRCSDKFSPGIKCIGCITNGDQVAICDGAGCCTGLPEHNVCCSSAPFIEVEFSDTPGTFFCVCP